MVSVFIESASCVALLAQQSTHDPHYVPHDDQGGEDPERATQDRGSGKAHAEPGVQEYDGEEEDEAVDEDGQHQASHALPPELSQQGVHPVGLLPEALHLTG